MPMPNFPATTLARVYPRTHARAPLVEIHHDSNSDHGPRCSPPCFLRKSFQQNAHDVAPEADHRYMLNVVTSKCCNLPVDRG